MRAFVRIFVVTGMLALFFYSNAHSQVREVNFKQLKSYFEKSNDTLYVINFWATWCKPCVKELPYFERVTRDYKHRKVAVLLVSLDFSKNLKSKVIPFVKKRDLQSRVLFLHQPPGHQWMNQVDPDWSGAIPATYFIKNGGNTGAFYEKSFDSYNELNNIIKGMI